MTTQTTCNTALQSELFLLIRGIASLMRYNAQRCRVLEDAHDNELCSVKRQGMAEAYDDSAMMIENFFNVKNALDLSVPIVPQCASTKEM